MSLKEHKMKGDQMKLMVLIISSLFLTNCGRKRNINILEPKSAKECLEAVDSHQKCVVEKINNITNCNEEPTDGRDPFFHLYFKTHEGCSMLSIDFIRNANLRECNSKYVEASSFLRNKLSEKCPSLTPPSLEIPQPTPTTPTPTTPTPNAPTPGTQTPAPGGTPTPAGTPTTSPAPAPSTSTSSSAPPSPATISIRPTTGGAGRPALTG